MNKNSIIYKSIRNLYYCIKNLPSITKLAIDTHSIKKFKNIHIGETCFIIGNGPSMRFSDLDSIYKLNVKSFACNKIFLGFSETQWRPDYFFVSDSKILKDIRLEEIGLSYDKMFFPRCDKKNLKKGNFYETLEHNWMKDSLFSSDSHKGVYAYGTIISEMLQFAYYMGFQKVYIIGVDFSYNMKSVDRKDRTFVSAGNNYFIKEYENEGAILNLSCPEANINGFNAARKGFESNGREIYNATRGGKLEVFIRKDLDEVFKEIEESKNENSSMYSN